MQNLPIIAATPTKPTQAPNPTDNNNAAQAAEPFGNVLARQRANAGTSPGSQKTDNQKSDSKQAVSPAANDATAAASAAVSNDPATQAQAPAPDASTIIPGAMLAALLPSTVGTDSPATAAKDKTVSQAPAPDGVSTLPSDMLGMMLPAATAATAATATAAATAATAAATAATTADAAAANRIAANEKGLQVSVTDMVKKAQPLPAATTALSETLQSAKNKAVSGGPVIPGGVASLLPAPGSAKPEAMPNTGKDNTFAAALGTLSKDAAKTAQLDTGTMKISVQPAAPSGVNSLMQSGVAPIAVSQSGVAQVAQAVINTPVMDKAWGNEFNQKITWMATQHEQTAELHLNPPNLGPLDVVLKVSGDQATALFTSPHAAVRDAVEQALPQLRDMLAGNGITLGNATVSDQSPRDQQAWQASQQQKGGGRAAGVIDTTVATESIASVTTASLGSRHLGMVDTFA